ncbi:glutathione S-transferase theta-1 [Drosophila mauritiana]|uniref:Glutathione S-transferase theta-1 n=1 Tax=Drosophila mauritiana TaxID=7226 RepID=A0A6P8JH17_DROMA|nr:glutathione S-transferase theta-1 [Drosophila mauritiana]
MSKPIRFYYDLLSPIARGLWIGLKFSNSPVEYCPIALRKFEQLTDEYKKINRFQKVPAIVDGGFHLSETIAIIRYLADKGQFDEKLYPKTLEDRARVDEFLEWQHLNIRLACSLYFRDAWLFPMNGIAPKPKPEQIQALIEGVENNLGLLERLWLENDFLVGKNLTMADILGSSEINQLRLCQYRVDEKKFPKVVKWLERVRESANPYHDEGLTFIDRKSKQATAAKL